MQLRGMLDSEDVKDISGGLRLETGLEDARACCLEAALDLGLVLKEQKDSQLVFRERIHWISWPVEISVSFALRRGHTEILVFGSSSDWGIPMSYSIHLRRLVEGFIARAEDHAREARVAEAAASRSVWKRRRAANMLFTLAQRAVLAVFVVFAVVVLVAGMDRIWLVSGSPQY